MTRRTHVVIGIGILITMLLVAFIYSNLERYIRYENEGPKLDVRLNPWHAAQQYLKLWNIESHRSFNLNPVLNKLQKADALILVNNGPVKNPGMQAQLFDWLANGGHLVIMAHNEWDFEAQSSDDDFLDALDIRLYSTADEEVESEEDSRDQASGSGESETAYVNQTTSESDAEYGSEDEQNTDPEGKKQRDKAGSTCNLANLENISLIRLDQRLLQIESIPEQTLEPAYDNDAITGEHWPNGILQIPVGEGKLTVLLDTTIWQDSRISELDHAYLLWHLVKDSTTTWFVNSDDSESLMQLLWRTAPFLLIALACLILAWAWQRWVRFGPMIQPPAQGHRKITEHIEASARFGWNHGEAQFLLEPLRDDIKQRVSRHCTFSYLNDTEHWLNYVAKIVRIEESILAAAMSGEAPRNEQGWTNLVNQLQTIRNAL